MLCNFFQDHKQCFMVMVACLGMLLCSLSILRAADAERTAVLLKIDSKGSELDKKIVDHIVSSESISLPELTLQDLDNINTFMKNVDTNSLNLSEDKQRHFDAFKEHLNKVSLQTSLGLVSAEAAKQLQESLGDQLPTQEQLTQVTNLAIQNLSETAKGELNYLPTEDVIKNAVQGAIANQAPAKDEPSSDELSKNKIIEAVSGAVQSLLKKLPRDAGAVPTKEQIEEATDQAVKQLSVGVLAGAWNYMPSAEQIQKVTTGMMNNLLIGAMAAWNKLPSAQKTWIATRSAGQGVWTGAQGAWAGAQEAWNKLPSTEKAMISIKMAVEKAKTPGKTLQQAMPSGSQIADAAKWMMQKIWGGVQSGAQTLWSYAPTWSQVTDATAKMYAGAGWVWSKAPSWEQVVEMGVWTQKTLTDTEKVVWNYVSLRKQMRDAITLTLENPLVMQQKSIDQDLTKVVSQASKEAVNTLQGRARSLSDYALLAKEGILEPGWEVTKQVAGVTNAWVVQPGWGVTKQVAGATAQAGKSALEALPGQISIVYQAGRHVIVKGASYVYTQPSPPAVEAKVPSSIKNSMSSSKHDDLRQSLLLLKLKLLQLAKKLSVKT